MRAPESPNFDIQRAIASYPYSLPAYATAYLLGAYQRNASFFFGDCVVRVARVSYGPKLERGLVQVFHLEVEAGLGV